MIKSKKAELFTQSAEVTMRGTHCSGEQVRQIRRMRTGRKLFWYIISKHEGRGAAYPQNEKFFIKSLNPKLL